MCEQCLCKPIYWGEPIKGYTLAQATEDGNTWRAGEWALIGINHPSYVWDLTPREDVTECNEDDIDSYISSMSSDADSGYKLRLACEGAGYIKTPSSVLEIWLFEYLGTWLRNHKPEPEEEYIYTDRH